MATLKDKVKELEKQEIVKALLECDWVMARAARQLGITERMIGYKVRKYGIRKEGESIRNSDEGKLDSWQENEKKASGIA